MLDILVSLILVMILSATVLLLLAAPLLILGLISSFKVAFLTLIVVSQTIAYLVVVRWRFIRSNFWTSLGISKQSVLENVWIGLRYWVVVELTALVWDFAATKVGLSLSGPGGRTWITDLSLPSSVFVFFSQSALGPFGEEIFFRGYVFKKLRERYSFRVSALISSFVFTAIHINPITFPIFFLHGYLYARATEETKSIIPSYTAHLLKNFLTILFQAIPAIWYVK
ncbi:CPBP family intramembrane metalloprotease [candidate division WWE3 bacterium]|nr:CPBP family intramembrane metalloprotease [candidate division WWE3 bacterium]